MRTTLLTLALSGTLMTACTTTRTPGVLDTGAMTLYEANVRQHTPEGTFDALRTHLPDLEVMGVGVIWLMPIHPIGELNRKGTLGSYYAATDYTAINPEFGDEASFRAFVDGAHDRGIKVILDWVANHTAWDHVWTKTHPERFVKDADGNFKPPNDDWDDVIDLDYDEPSTADAMIEAMRYWVTEFNIDGFRCDVAELVPQEFWSRAIKELRTERDLFMLAEGHEAWLHDVGFDATYGWVLGDNVMNIVKGESNAGDLREALERNDRELGGFGDQRFRVFFTTNHDWNSWNGVALERFGPAWEAATVLSFTLPAMPLIYGGQEAGLDKQLEFFEKDQVEWRDHPARDLYTTLSALKEETPALRHGDANAVVEYITAGNRERVFAFKRTSGASGVVVVANLSAEPAKLYPTPGVSPATHTDPFGGDAVWPDELGAWSWRVFVTKR